MTIIKRRPPHWKCYASDFIAARGYRLASNAERGLLWHMLNTEWVDGPLPARPDDLAKFLGLPFDEAFRCDLSGNVLSFFDRAEVDGAQCLVSPELELCRREFEATRKAQSDGARMGQKRRWKKAKGETPKSLKATNHAGSEGCKSLISPALICNALPCVDSTSTTANREKPVDAHEGCTEEQYRRRKG